MVKKELLKNVNRLGFPLMEPEEDLDVNKTLAEVVKSKDTRLWEGFPVLLANTAREYKFNYDEVLKYLTKKESRDNFHSLLLLSLALYKNYHLSFAWSNHLKEKVSNQYVNELKQLRNQLTHNEVVAFNNMQFSSSRLRETFRNYFEQDAKKTKQLKEKHEELSLEYALSQLFSPKQKELFRKKLEGEPLTKTEREYYSRTVKKKVAALANPELHRLAQKLMEY
jgi:hypothetical protein